MADIQSEDETMAHCGMCHETFPAKDVVIRKSGADICPLCKAENFTCVFDGVFTCCGEI